MKQTKKLDNPPLKETFCSFEFPEDTEWDETTPGLIFTAVKKMGFKEKKEGHSIELKLTTEEGGPSIEKMPRMRIFNDDKTQVILVGKFRVSFNSIDGHYSGWEDYFKFIQSGLGEVLDALDYRDIKRFTLGYLNAIKLEAKREIEEFFKFRPSVHGDFNIDEVTSFICGLELKSVIPDGLMRITLTDDHENDIAGVLYEIVFESGRLEKTELPVIFDSISAAHDKIEEHFFNSLEAKLLKRFL